MSDDLRKAFDGMFGEGYYDDMTSGSECGPLYHYYDPRTRRCMVCGKTDKDAAFQSNRTFTTEYQNAHNARQANLREQQALQSLQGALGHAGPQGFYSPLNCGRTDMVDGTALSGLGTQQAFADMFGPMHSSTKALYGQSLVNQMRDQQQLDAYRQMAQAGRATAKQQVEEALLRQAQQSPANRPMPKKEPSVTEPISVWDGSGLRMSNEPYPPDTKAPELRASTFDKHPWAWLLWSVFSVGVNIWFLNNATLVPSWVWWMGIAADSINAADQLRRTKLPQKAFRASKRLLGRLWGLIAVSSRWSYRFLMRPVKQARLARLARENQRQWWEKQFEGMAL